MSFIGKHLRGSMVVEAALIFPWVIAVILPFIYLLYGLLIQSILEAALDKGLREMAVEAYVLERLLILPEQNAAEADKVPIEAEEVQELKGVLEKYMALRDLDSGKEMLEAEALNIAGQYLLKKKLKNHIQEEQLERWGILDGWQGISFSESQFFYTKDGRKRLIRGVISFKWNIVLPFWRLPDAKIERVYHTFVGEDARFEQEKAENASTETIVYRIGQGAHYHSLECYLIQKDIVAQVRQQAQGEGREACERCHPQQEVIVYMTIKGEHYHRQGCAYLYPQLSSMRIEEALQQGYTGLSLIHI